MPKLSLAEQKLKMARWIEKGLQFPCMCESFRDFISESECDVIGLAMVGKFGSPAKALEVAKRIFLELEGKKRTHNIVYPIELWRNSWRIASKALSVDKRLISKILILHGGRFGPNIGSSHIATKLRAEVKKVKQSTKLKPAQDWFNRGNKP